MIYTSRTFPLEHSLEEADACLLGIPWDSTETGKSVKHGPLFIREAIKGIPGFDPASERNVFEKKWCDLGDVEIVPGNWSLTKERILDTLEFMFKTNSRAFPVFLGGDHLITLGILESLVVQYKKLTVVHFDAHADVSSSWLGERFSHITWGYHALKDLGVNMVQFGVRSSTSEEQEFLKQCNQIKTLEQVQGPVYMTVDMDVFDPGFAPEVGTPEPLGLQPREFFDLLKKVCAHQLVGMDVVECASTRVGTPTAVLAAQIIKKALCLKESI